MSTEMAGVNIRLDAGAIRELHWHKATDEEVSPRQWMAVLPPELVQAHLQLPQTLVNNLPKTKDLIVG